MIKQLAEMDEQDLRTFVTLAAQATQTIMPGGKGPYGRALFCLLVFDEDVPAQYVSNAHPTEGIAAMQAVIERIGRRN
jgi:hypothetical protein